MKSFVVVMFLTFIFVTKYYFSCNWPCTKPLVFVYYRKLTPLTLIINHLAI